MASLICQALVLAVLAGSRPSAAQERSALQAPRSAGIAALPPVLAPLSLPLVAQGVAFDPAPFQFQIQAQLAPAIPPERIGQRLLEAQSVLRQGRSGVFRFGDNLLVVPLAVRPGAQAALLPLTGERQAKIGGVQEIIQQLQAGLESDGANGDSINASLGALGWVFDGSTLEGKPSGAPVLESLGTRIDLPRFVPGRNLDSFAIDIQAGLAPGTSYETIVRFLKGAAPVTNRGSSWVFRWGGALVILPTVAQEGAQAALFPLASDGPIRLEPAGRILDRVRLDLVKSKGHAGLLTALEALGKIYDEPILIKPRPNSPHYARDTTAFRWYEDNTSRVTAAPNGFMRQWRVPVQGGYSFSPDGASLVMTESNNTLRILDIRAGRSYILSMFGKLIGGAEREIVHTGRHVVFETVRSAGRGSFKDIRIVELSTGRASDITIPEGWTLAGFFPASLPDGKVLVRFIQAAAGNRLQWAFLDPARAVLSLIRLEAIGATARDVMPSPDGKRLVFLTDKQESVSKSSIVEYDVSRREIKKTIKKEILPGKVRFTTGILPGGARLMAVGAEYLAVYLAGHMMIIDRSRGIVLADIDIHESAQGTPGLAAFDSGDSRLTFIQSTSAGARRWSWNWKEGRAHYSRQALPSLSIQTRASADGRLLASPGSDRSSVELIDLRN